MDHCGVKVSKTPDGKIIHEDVIPGGLEMAGIEVSVCKSLRNFALKLGIRLLSRINLFELLTDENGAVNGAVGFDMDKGEFHIFHTKAIAMATQGCHFKKIGLEFMGYGTGVGGAAYRAGAVMRKC